MSFPGNPDLWRRPRAFEDGAQLALMSLVVDPRLRRAVRRHHALEATRNGYFLVTGTGMPGILTLTAPRWLRLVK
jgi:hypothetical protein